MYYAQLLPDASLPMYVDGKHVSPPEYNRKTWNVFGKLDGIDCWCKIAICKDWSIAKTGDEVYLPEYGYYSKIKYKDKDGVVLEKMPENVSKILCTEMHVIQSRGDYSYINTSYAAFHVCPPERSKTDALSFVSHIWFGDSNLQSVMNIDLLENKYVEFLSQVK